MKNAPVSFAQGVFKSFVAFLLFVMGLSVWAFGSVKCGGISWGWGAVAVALAALTLWELCHITDWVNGVFQAIMGGVELDSGRVFAVLGGLLLLDLALGGLAYYVGMVAFGKGSCTGVNAVTVVYTSALTMGAIIGEIVAFSLVDLPNDMLDGWIASKAAREPTPQVEVLRAQKMLHDTDRAGALAQVARMRAKQEAQLTAGMGNLDDAEWSLDEGPTQY